MKRLRAGFVIVFAFAVLLVGLGLYSIYYFFALENARPTYLLGGSGVTVFGCIFVFFR